LAKVIAMSWKDEVDDYKAALIGFTVYAALIFFITIFGAFAAFYAVKHMVLLLP
jgi:hypothetical protein